MNIPSDKSPVVESDGPPSQSAVAPPRPKRWTLRILAVVTALYVLTVLLAFLFPSRVDERFGIGMDVVMVASLFTGAPLLLLWVGWALVFSGWIWKVRILAAVALLLTPVVLVKVLRPVLSGDVMIARFEPIWSSRPETPSSDVQIPKSDVDLTTETPNDFARFLGPDQNSVIPGDRQIAADRFTDSKILWRQPIGEGWSGFVARNGFAVTMEQRQDQECVTCYDLSTGELRWLYQHQARHRDASNLGRIGPRSTPTIHEGRIYAVGAVGNFVCLDGRDGAVVWQVDLNQVLGLELTSSVDSDGLTIQYEADSSLSWGRSGSPLIFEDTVIVPGGGPQQGTVATLLAFNQKNGDLVWKGGREMIAYGSPTLATVAGIPQLLMIAESQTMGFQPETGDVLWTWSRPGASNGQANTSQATAIGENQILTSKGYPDGGGELIELTSVDGTLVPKSVWNNPRVLKTKLMSPVVFEGHAYSLSNAFLECCRISDGQRIWKHRGRFGHGQMLLVDDQILLHTESGELMLVKATPEGYQDAGTVPTISGVCWNTLCLYGNRLLVRSELEAACLELPMD